MFIFTQQLEDDICTYNGAFKNDLGKARIKIDFSQSTKGQSSITLIPLLEIHFLKLLPPFVGAQLSKCAAQGKVTRKGIESKDTHFNRLPLWLLGDYNGNIFNISTGNRGAHENIKKMTIMKTISNGGGGRAGYFCPWLPHLQYSSCTQKKDCLYYASLLTII